MEPPIGLEPTVTALQKRCFTIKLQGRKNDTNIIYMIIVLNIHTK